MKIPFLNLGKQHQFLREEIYSEFDRILNNSNFILGEDVYKFERNFSKLIGTKHCISCGNGTDALYIAIKALGIKSGDEVITTSHSWISTSEIITMAGAKPIFCDIDDDSYCISPKDIKRKITKRTVGIIPVHLYGNPAEMIEIQSIAKKNNLWIIEDCAQAHLAEIQGEKVGTFGNIATFSFYPGKNLGAIGDAGCMVTNDDKLANWCKLFARHGGKGTHEIEGINSRMDNIQAAILNIKLKHIEKWTLKRQNLGKNYNKNLSEIEALKLPNFDNKNNHVFHLYTIRTKQRDELKEFLKLHKVQTHINYPCSLPFLNAYNYLNHQFSDFPIAHKFQSEILSLPIYPEMEGKEQKYIIDLIKDFYK